MTVTTVAGTVFATLLVIAFVASGPLASLHDVAPPRPRTPAAGAAAILSGPRTDDAALREVTRLVALRTAACAEPGIPT